LVPLVLVSAAYANSFGELGIRPEDLRRLQSYRINPEKTDDQPTLHQDFPGQDLPQE
jgi:hypothetical protein